MNEIAPPRIIGDIVAALRESFRISEADRRARLGAFRRVFINAAQVGSALFYPLWVASQTPRRMFSDGVNVYNTMADIGFFLVATGWFLCALFCRVEMYATDKSGRIRTTHPAGQFGGRILAAGALLLCVTIALDAFVPLAG